MKKTLYATLLATAMIPAVTVAQTSPTTPPADTTTADPATPPAATEAPVTGSTDTTETPASGAVSTEAPATGAASTASATEGPFVTVPPTGAWRATDLTGKGVEDAAGENIGSISDVLVDETGEVIAVLVGVGGFLGIGAKDVAVSMEALEFGPGSLDGLSTAPAAEAAPVGGVTAEPVAGEATAPTQPVIGDDNLPDRIVLAVTREELDAAPAYGEPETGEADDTTAPAGGAVAPAGGTAPAAPQ